MDASMLSAQLSHDFALPLEASATDAAPETTAAEALRGRIRRAAKAGEKFLDSVECEVNESDGDCQVVISLWPCTWDDRAKLADALEALAREIRPFQQTK